jgi:hypothetical protein
VPIDEVKENLREAVAARVYAFANAFNDIDYATIGVIAKDDFRKVVNEHAFRVSDDQVIWVKFSKFALFSVYA